MPPRLPALCLAACGVSIAVAQPTPAAEPPASASRPAILTPLPAPQTSATASSPRSAPGARVSAPPRAISPAITAKISAAIAQAAPFAGTAPSGTGATTGTASDDPNIVMLDPLIVTDDRLRYAQERHLMTSKGWLELARQRYPDAPTNGMAMFLLSQDLAIERRQEIDELQKLDALSSKKHPPEIQRLIDSAARPSPDGMR